MREINWPLFERAVDAIKSNPDHWDQTKIHCGTAHCFAGFVHILDLIDRGRLTCPLTEISGDSDSKFGRLGLSRLQTEESLDMAESLLGISTEQGEWLFNFDRTIKDFDRCITERKIPDDILAVWP